MKPGFVWAAAGLAFISAPVTHAQDAAPPAAQNDAPPAPEAEASALERVEPNRSPRRGSSDRSMPKGRSDQASRLRLTTRSAPPSVLAILAHPDDEITIAPILARVAREGGTVTLIYATSGDAGPGSSGLERSDKIATMREKEGRCAAFALGLEDPIFWKLGDGSLAPMARAPDSAAAQALSLTRAAIAKAKPNVIMTWGPDGGYGHADHRMISAIVTQAVASLGDSRPELLYTAFPQGAGGIPAGFESWATTSVDLLTDAIRYQPGDLNATETAIRCYESQFPLPARQGLVRLLHERVWQGKVHFRMAFAPPR